MGYPSQRTLHQLAEMNYCDFVPVSGYNTDFAKAMPMSEYTKDGLCFALGNLYLQCNGDIELYNYRIVKDLKNLVRIQAIYINLHKYLTTFNITNLNLADITHRNFFNLYGGIQEFDCEASNEYPFYRCFLFASMYQGFSLLKLGGPYGHIIIIDNRDPSNFNYFDSCFGVFTARGSEIMNKISRLTRNLRETLYMFYGRAIYPAKDAHLFLVESAKEDIYSTMPEEMPVSVPYSKSLSSQGL